VVAVGSLAALALQGVGEDLFTLTDARMGEVYFAAWHRRHGGLDEVVAPACAPPEEVALPPQGNWFALGGALAAYAPRLRLPADRLRGTQADAVPRAADVARLAAPLVRQGELLAPEQAVPLYVRDKVALTTAERLARGGRS
jgi:tRNA threonylcarbamoyladenosine biosynthesis protein TsaB